MDKLERVARAICAEKCAFMGEPPCYSVEGEWPNRNCSEPGCHAEAQAAIAALEPATVQEAAEREVHLMDEDEAADLRYELAQVTAQRDMLREIVAVMQPHLSPAGQAAFYRWKKEGVQRIADELHCKLMEASDG